ncbi:ABC transporter substrate-binding protein [Amycolatopsis sp. NBC_00355]|uniref:hypothetical protein n=1 Tax=Amycolatopsis sp. NBC_00355 TaxID=2975957 RepID=UPI002E257B6D
MTGGGSSAALVIGSAFLDDLGPLFPVRLNLAGEDLEFTFVLSEHPPGGVTPWVQQWSGTGVGGLVPRFFVDASGRRIRVELAGSAVRAVIVVPAEDPASPHRGRWQDQVPTALKLALEEIARMLSRCHHYAGGTEPLIDLELGYRPEAGYEARLAAAHETAKGWVRPVRPVLGMRWRTATAAQRKAFADELPEVTSARRWIRRRRTARIMGLEVELPP